MHPILLHIGPITIHSYGAMYALGIIAAVALSEYLYRREGGKPETISDLALPVVVGVLLGARVLFIIVERQYYLQNPSEIPMIWKGGLVFYGGLVGGALALIISARMKKLDLWRLADTIAPGIALGHAIGRLGCFLAGSCYGRPTDLPWAVTYTDPSSLASDVLGVPVHPTQLYSAAFLVLLSAILVFVGSRSRFRGQVFTLYAVLYGTFRFTMEFFRGDPRGEATLLGLTFSTSQWISMILVPVALIVYCILFKKGGTDRGPGEILFQDGAETALR